MGLWDFKVSLQIFTIFQHLWYRHRMGMFGMIARWKTSTAGVERCQLDTCNTKKKRQSRVRIQFLAARARLFRTKQTKKEPACSVVEQAGVPIDRVFGLSIERKGLFYLLALESIDLVSTEDEDLTVIDKFSALYITLNILNSCCFF